MLLWIVFALLTAVALAAVLRPLLTPAAAGSTGPDGKDVAVYRDQLAELEHDKARAVIGPEEAELARREIVRRMLRAADAGSVTVNPGTFAPQKLGLVLAAVLPLVAVGGYVKFGSPGLPARPFTERRAAEIGKAPLQDLIAKVEAQLARNPADGKGWDVIAPVYFRLERFDDAARAYQNAARILGDTTDRLAGFAEATVMASNGIVTEPARQAYEKLRASEPSRVEPKFWLTLALEQDGKTAEAIAGYKALLDGADSAAPWRPLVEQRLTALGVKPAGPRLDQLPGRGPTAGDVKAAESMSEAERSQMISGMIEGLAARLKKDGKDAAGWQRLVQAYVILGEAAKAQQAVADAKEALKGESSATPILTQLDALLKSAPPAPAPGVKQ